MADRTLTLDDELIARYVEEDPRRPGPSNARIVDWWIPVWAIVGYLQAMPGEVQEVADGYEIPLDAVLAAIAFYQRHQDAIEARIAANAL